MTEEQVLLLRNKLLEKRNEIFEQVNQMESRWESMEEKEIELEEEAQKASIAEAYNLLDGRGKVEIDLIDFALNKVALGEYGICESCGDDISIKRLDALPWARMCVDCAREYEKKRLVLPPTTELFAAGRLPSRYRGMSGKQILKLIFEKLRTDSRITVDGFTVSIQNGSIHIEGTVATEPEHQAILETLTAGMGFSAIVDHLEIDEYTEKRRRVTASAARHTGFEEEIEEEREESTDEAFEDQDEGVISRPSEDRVWQLAAR
jgi:DnaK suppressor protein